MNILPQNKEVFDITNVSLWQKDNKGEGITILMLDEDELSFDYMKNNVEILFPDGDLKTGHATSTMASGYQIAPNARILVMDFNHAKPDARLQMIEWIIEHENEIGLINVSLSYDVFAARRYFPQLENLDIPIICSTGNNGSDSKINYPAKYDWTIAVGEYSQSLGHVVQQSNKGKEVTCVAPSYIYYLNSIGKPVAQYGTSISAPFVTFSLALYLSWRKRNKLPKLSREEIKQFIHENAKDLYEKGHDYRSGYGLFRLPERIPEVKEVIEVPEFPDVKKDRWSAADIDLVSNLGIMQGLPDGTFAPAKAVTREEIATVIARLIREGYIRK